MRVDNSRPETRRSDEPERTATAAINPDLALNEDRDLNRVHAARIVAMLLQTQTTLTDATVSIAKWVLTSLLAINGAGAIATWQIAMDPRTKVLACSCFVLGTLAALLCGHLQVRSFAKLMRPLGEQVGYWISVQDDGVRVSSLEKHEQLEAIANRSTRLPNFIGWAAAALFAVGAVISGYGGLHATRGPTVADQSRGA
jgi:hypothetical protein